MQPEEKIRRHLKKLRLLQRWTVLLGIPEDLGIVGATATLKWVLEESGIPDPPGIDEASLAEMEKDVADLIVQLQREPKEN